MQRVSLAFALLSITSIAAAAQAPASKTSFTGDIGYVSASGNTRLTTLSLGEKIGHTTGRWTLSQLAAYVYGKADSVETANQLRIAGRADYDFIRRVAIFVGVAHERNRFAGFDARTDEIAGLRWLAIVAPMDSLGLDLGGVLTQQSNVDGTSMNDPSARVAGNYKHLFSKAAYFQQLAEYLPNVKEGGEYRLNTESSLVAPISSHIGIKMSYSFRHNTSPPATFGRSDRVLTTGIQVTY
jgi:putative salt-induced outer membrane protein